MSRVGARREREGTVPRATAVPRLAKPARHAGYAPGTHRSIGGCRRSGEAASLRRADRPRTEASAGRAYLVCRAGFRRPRHAARAGHRAFHSRVRSRPEMYLGSAAERNAPVCARAPAWRMVRDERPFATETVARFPFE